MNWKSTIALVILAAGAGAWLWKGDAWAPKLANRAARPDAPALTALEGDLKPDAIARIEIVPHGGDPFVFERVGKLWKQHGNWPLLTVEVDDLVKVVGNLRTRFQPVPLPEGEEAAFGLTDAQQPVLVKVTVSGREKPYELAFGEAVKKPGETAFTRPAYLRVGDAKEVFKLGPDVLPMLRRAADSYRRRQLFFEVERVELAGAAPPFPMPGMQPEPAAPNTVTLPGPDVEEIRVIDKSKKPAEPLKWHQESTFALRRIGPTPAPSATEKNAEPTVQPERLSDAWALESPVRDRADPAALQRVLAAVPDLWVEHFVPAKETKFALDHPYSIAQMLPTLEPFPAALVRFHPDAAVLDPLRGKVAAPARSKLDKSEQSVTVKTKTGLPVTVKFGGTIITTREETETITPPFPGAQPTTETRVIPTTYRYAQVEGNPQVFTVPADKVSALFLSAGSLVESRVAAFKPDEVRSVTVARPGLPPIVLNRKKGDPKATKPEEKQGQWEIDLKEGARTADGARVEELIGRLASFNGNPDTDLYGNEAKPRTPNPATSIAVTVVTREKRPDGDPDAPPREHKLLIGAPDFAKGQLPVQLAGWPRVTLVSDRSGPPPAGWLGPMLFPERLEPIFRRDSIAYRARKLFDTTDPTVKLTGVTVDGASGFALRQEMTADKREVWKLTAPIASSADAKAADALHTKLSELQATEFVAEPAANPAAFGLDKPKFTADLVFSNGRTYRLEVGGPRPDKKGEVYARFRDGAVFALPAAETDALAGGALALLPLQVWAVPFDQITGVEITRDEAAKAESFALAKDGANWKLSGPFAAPVGALDAQRLINGLSLLPSARYEALTAPDLAKYGLDKPIAKIKLSFLETGSDGPRPTAKAVVIGGVTPGGLDRYAKLDEPTAPIFVLPAQYLFAVQTPPLSLLDRNLLLLDPAKIAKVQIAGDKPESAVTLTKGEKEKWTAEGATFTVDTIVVRQLTFMFAPLPVERLAAFGDAVKWADYGLDKPEYTVTVTLAGDKPAAHKLHIGKADPTGGRFVRADDGKAVGVIPAFAVQALARTKLDFADRTLLAFKPDELLGIARTKGKDEFELAPGAGDGWDVVKPAKQKADKLLMEELADVLARLRADKVAAFGKKADVYKQFGLDTPEAVVTLTVGEKAEQKVLRFGRPVDATKPDGDRYAAVDDPGADAAVGVLPAALVTKLLAPPVSFRDRTIAKFVDADKLELERGPRKVTFAKVNGTWKVTAPLAADAEQAALDDLVNELARLRASDWAADKPTPAELKTFGLENPEAVWTVTNGDKVVLALRVGKKLPDGRVYATAAAGGSVALLGAPQTAKVLAEYRTRKPWVLDGFQAEAVTFKQSDKTFAIQKFDGKWIVPGAPDVVDPKAVAEVLGALTALQVERYAVDANGDPKLFGLDKPDLQIAVIVKDGFQALEIGGFVGGTDNKQRYARVVDKGRSDVFVLSAADTARLTRDRASFVQKK